MAILGSVLVQDTIESLVLYRGELVGNLCGERELTIILR